jgi:hypothetical protein
MIGVATRMSRGRRACAQTRETTAARDGHMTSGSSDDRLGNRLLTSREAARYLGISERHLWAITKEKLLRSKKLKRAVRYDVLELDRYIAADETDSEGR